MPRRGRRRGRAWARWSGFRRSLPSQLSPHRLSAEIQRWRARRLAAARGHSTAPPSSPALAGPARAGRRWSAHRRRCKAQRNPAHRTARPALRPRASGRPWREGWASTPQAARAGSCPSDSRGSIPDLASDPSPCAEPIHHRGISARGRWSVG